MNVRDVDAIQGCVDRRLRECGEISLGGELQFYTAPGRTDFRVGNGQLSFGNLRIIRWAEFLAGKPTRLTAYLMDGVRTSVPAGQVARNELIVQSIETE